MERNTTSASYTDNSRFDSCARKHIAEGKATSGAVCPRRLTEKPSGYDPLDARSSRAGDTVAVAERLCSGLWCRLMRVQSLRSTPVGAERVPKGTQHPVSHLDDSRSGTQVPLLSLILDQWFYWSFVQWQGSCLIHSRCTIRRIVFDIPQLRSCFSGVMVAQLICNQPVVGSMSAC